MGFIFRKRIKIAPGLHINLSKSGPSVSVGKPGATFNIGPKGTRTTVGAPGTGMSYRTDKSWGGISKDLGKPKTATKSAPKITRRAESAPAENTDELNPSYLKRLSIPDDDEALIDGCRQLLQGDENEALVTLRKALHLPDGAFLAGVLALKQDQYGEAVNFLSFCLEHQQELGQRLAKYGIRAVVLIPVTEEISAQVAPDPDGALLALSEAYQHQNQPNQAADCLRRLLQTHTSDLVLRISLAELLASTWPGERGACEEVLRLGDGVDNDSELHAALLLYKAQALKGMGLLDGARDVLTSTLRKSKDRSTELLQALRYERALVYTALGQAKDARADLEKLYATEPTYEDVASRLGLA